MVFSMPQKFIIQANPLPDISAMVYATGEIHPFEKLSDLETELLERELGGIVVFDLLFASGNTRNRYHIGLLGKSGFLPGKMYPVEDVGSLREVSAAFLQSNVSEFRLDMLSSPIEWAVRNGVPV